MSTNMFPSIVPPRIWSVASIEKQWAGCCGNNLNREAFFVQLDLPARAGRLLGVALCRDIQPLIRDRYSLLALEIAERYADGLANDHELAVCHRKAATIDTVGSGPVGFREEAASACEIVSRPGVQTSSVSNSVAAAYAHSQAAAPTVGEARHSVEFLRAKRVKWAVHAKLIVSVVGPGWTFDPEWRTSTAVAMARGMYEAREFSGVPILADAVQDAGCTKEELLRQMRDPESLWCRGSRIIDELLGKR